MAGPSSLPIINKNHIDECTSPQESLSSLSVESLETELLEQCISSGMPKATSKIPDSTNQLKRTRVTHEKPKSKENAFDKRDNSKNVNVASVARNTSLQVERVCPVTRTMVAGVEYAQDEIEKIPNHQDYNNTTAIEGTRSMDLIADTLQGKYSPTDENLSIEPMKNGFKLETLHNNFVKIDEIELNITTNDDEDNKIGANCDNAHKVEDRMLDPDAMIESLDRFTAELVSQVSHLEKKESSKFMASITEDNISTWNEDTSPNDLTFPSISVSAPNVVTFPSENDTQNNISQDVLDGIKEPEHESNDFSSINTSTLTESTLIAIEATKIATQMKQEADLNQSLTSINSLELDNVMPPSELQSISLSGVENAPSPKLSRKKLPPSFMIKKVFTNSLNRTSSAESISNLEQMNPPSAMGEIFDMEGSMNSVASLISDNVELKPNFITNGIVMQQATQLIMNNKQFMSSNRVNNTNYSISDLDHINPPSLLNDITDMCNSLADVQTDTVYSQTEVFEDCRTHLTLDDNLQTEDEVTEYSEAHSETPIPSELCSSVESTPKRVKTLQKRLTAKQKRNLTKERYKTYTIAAEMVMKEEQDKLQQQEAKQEENLNLLSKDGSVDAEELPNDTLSEAYKTFEVCTETYHTANSEKTNHESSGRLTPKQRRRENRSRFQTQVLDEVIVNSIAGPSSNAKPCYSDESFGSSPLESPSQSPAKTKTDIRRSFIKKRLENKDRFRTQTLSESSLSPDISCGSPPLSLNSTNDVHYMLQKEANVVLKTLSETKTKPDDLLDCETLSLVSIEEDSDHNSGCSMNYRTYHKSWGFRNNNIPIIDGNNSNQTQQQQTSQAENVDDDSEQQKQQKPKIIKPNGKQDVEVEEQPQEKGIRGRRKLLYSKSSTTTIGVKPKTVTKPVASVTSSNLVKNVTSTLKTTNLINKALASKPPMVGQLQQPKRTLRAPTTSPKSASTFNNTKQSPSNSTKNSPSSSTKNSPINSTKNSPKRRTPLTAPITPLTKQKTPVKLSPMDRQGTFTKEETKIPTPKSKIPTTSSLLKPRSSFSPSSRPKTSTSNIPSRSQLTKPSSERNTVRQIQPPQTSPNRAYMRSTSADCNTRKTNITKNSSTTNHNLPVKKSNLPEPPKKSNSSSNINNAATQQAKQVTSKIASLWKKIEESKNKNQSQKPDTRVWIQPDIVRDTQQPRMIRSNTFENKNDLIQNSNGHQQQNQQQDQQYNNYMLNCDDGNNDLSDNASF